MKEMKIKGIHHLSIKPIGEEHWKKTVEFYSVVLGMPIVREWENPVFKGVMIDTGAGLLEICSHGDEIPLTSLVRHIAFEVDSAKDWIERVRKAGYEIIKEPTDIEINSVPPLPATIAFCRGPVGEEIEFFELR